ncbi:ImmA/IrrE family metallo-endopeptidase [Clostridioides difficile]|uniref:ImmA/IrrE family metallo-endopeptidase n=1 Tax=Clostridioides difficile TaxID=1496 RepID=UPI0008A58D0E|nr:ImmA/IrrE family metallo-endopeptidase [Clostridioides difficile]OFU33498.1 transcriptional regulator [Clostridium sp. HMSC19B11]EGT3847659.1 ImmA/IrrE family metallo-endopeptidase [Clostridioides difficile]EGT4698883.1 ImmA/IrrE family metallo-endopeptidase [Clostridioides difficile]EGT4917110.1 ImmA/IrrE family metallo-endopeptidase [Clostridioides difficile]MBH7452519.1 ImmA/IrrE family metallo-endopeptidase [Clostridioides difficile]
MNDFNGERLKKARIYREMTVVELAQKMKCERQVISMYENNKLKPSDNIIKRIAKELYFPSKFFLEKEKKIIQGSSYFRALLTTNKKYRKKQVERMEFLSQIYFFLQDYIEFPTLNLPNCFYKTPEEAALLLREAWGLGLKPINNLIYEVEKHGIIVTGFPTSIDYIDTFSQMIDIEGKTMYLIGYSNNNTSASRLHFDIAHELGHICLHEWSEDVEALEKQEFKDRESEANRFASAFLLPEETFKIDAKRTPLRIPNYTELKRKWKVSIQAMIRRSYSLGIISMDEYQSMIRTLQRRGLRKSEPLDDELLTSLPALLKTAVLMLLNEKIFTSKEFMNELSFSYNFSLDPKELENILDLPNNTLNSSKILYLSDVNRLGRA